MLDLNAHCGGSAGPNAWENPSLTGMNRLPPHSKNIRKLSETYYDYTQLSSTQTHEIYQRYHPTGPHPCICLDTPRNRSGCDERHNRVTIFQPINFDNCDEPPSELLDESMISAIRQMRESQSYQPKSTVLQTTEDGWKFRLFPNPKCIPKGYILPSSSSSSLSSSDEEELSYCTKKASIPSNWTMEDHTECCGVHDPPRYTNVQMPFDVLYPHVPTDNPTGVYRLEFSALPKGWVKSELNGSTQIKRRVVLHLGGIESCFFVYMNGEFVGMGKDSRLPSEFDVTPFIHHQEDCMNDNDGIIADNVLAIVVLKWCDGVFLEQQDHWRGMAGIHRSVYLYSTPADAYIEDVFCQATITNLREPEGQQAFPPQYKGLLKIQARIGRDDSTRIIGRNIYYNSQIECARANDVTYRLVFQLYDKNWKPMFEEPIDPTYEGNKLVNDSHLRSGLVAFQVEVPQSIMAWSDESPTLYRLRVTLVQINPASANLTCDIDVFTCKVGFRNIEIANRELLINGQPVLIKGVNRHDHSSTGGKTVSLREIRTDLMMMKEYNFNAVRTAHYPNDPYVYEMADKLGLYVIDEANIECHGHYDMICREHTFASAMCDRVQRMVVRDQNHPSIIGWSLGNEAGYSMNHKMIYGWVKGYDSSRFAQYEGANRPQWGQLPHDYSRSDSAMGSDVICPMYPSIKEMIDWADNIAPSLNETRPLIMCEYAHAMGNSSGSLSDYWKAIKEKKGLQGGFIWDWVDQGLQQKTEAENVLEVKVWHKYGGDYGDSPHDANFNINGMVSPDRLAHPAMYEHKKCAQPVDFELKTDGQLSFTLGIRNGKYFSTLDGLILGYSLKVGGFGVKRGTYPIPSNVLPQESVDILIVEIREAFIEAADDLTEWVDAEIHLDVGLAPRESFVGPYPNDCIASEQFALREYMTTGIATTAAPEPLYLKKFMTFGSTSKPTVGVDGDGGTCTLSSNGFNLTFQPGTVKFEYSSGNKKPLIYGMMPNLFRAATDNDAVKQNGDQANDETKPLGNWLRLGLDCLSLGDVKVERVGSCEFDDAEYPFPSIITTATIYGLPGKNVYDGIALAEKVATSLQGKEQAVKLGKWQQKVTMHSNGCLFIEASIDLDESLKDLPRVGVQLSIPNTMSRECSFADGPRENYPDRCLAAHAGVVHRPFLEEYPRTYCVPQEQENRMNMRWL